jgi:hypothetical protein
MSRYVYISCEQSERELEQVKSLYDFLRVSNCVVEFAPEPSNQNFYRIIEDSIERSDAFIAVAGIGLDGSTWLNFALHHAYNLYINRMSPRPRLFGLHVQGNKVPRISEHIKLEWLNESNRELLLVDALRHS